MNNIRTSTTIAQLKNASLSYPSAEGDVDVLKDVNLNIYENEIVAVIGPSGSGKSSLIALLGGLEPASHGETIVLDHDLKTANETLRTRMRRGPIGIVFQSFHLVATMTALQNAALPLLLSGEKNPQANAQEMLERVGLGHRLHHLPSALSGGEQQRVAIARAFAAKPRLILADEPTGNLDQSTGDDVVKVMFELVRETKAAMVLVTHDNNLAQRCDRIITLNSGRVIA